MEEEDSETETSQKDVEKREELANAKRSVSLPAIRHHDDIFDEEKEKVKPKERVRKDAKGEQPSKKMDPRDTRLLNEHWG